MTMTELHDLTELADLTDDHLHHAEALARSPEGSAPLVLATVLEALAPLASAYHSLYETSRSAIPARPWPPGTVVRLVSDGSVVYGVLAPPAASQVGILVQHADGALIAYAPDQLAWVSAPCSVSLALLATHKRPS
jgi:hypothetical protein